MPIIIDIKYENGRNSKKKISGTSLERKMMVVRKILTSNKKIIEIVLNLR